MRIQDLLEGKNFDDLEFVKQDGDKKEISYDLPDDLIHFMHNDDHAYRRHLFPAIARCMDQMSSKKPTNMNVFKPAVMHSFKLYADKFPIKELPNELDEKMCERICNKMHDDVIKDIKDGVYKD